MKKHNKTIQRTIKTFNLINSLKNDEGKVYKSNDELREPLEMSRRTIVRYLNELEYQGKIKKRGTSRGRVITVI